MRAKVIAHIPIKLPAACTVRGILHKGGHERIASIRSCTDIILIESIVGFAKILPQLVAM